MKPSPQQIAVALALMQNPHGQHWGYSLLKTTELRSGVLYPILRRWHNAGWLADGWQDQPDTPGRPPRRFYTLTEDGLREIMKIASTAPSPGVTKTATARFQVRRPATGGFSG